MDDKEFLAFTHPEENPDMLPIILQQTLDEKDVNKDGLIDFQEYIGDSGEFLYSSVFETIRTLTNWITSWKHRENFSRELSVWL